jgi:hypothetical protein
MRLYPLAVIFGLLGASLCLSRADDGHVSKKSWEPQSDTEIRQKIVGTWVSGGTFTNQNDLVSFSQALTFTTNRCYSAMQTIISAGKTNVETCQGFWSIKDHLLTYLVTNSVGVKPDSEPFFYLQAKVVRINGNYMFLSEWMDHLASFERVGYRLSFLSLSEFRFFGRSTTVKQLEARVGFPDVDIMVSPGSGDNLVFYLADDTSLTIDTDGGSRILRVQHGQTILFEQPRLPSDFWMGR